LAKDPTRRRFPIFNRTCASTPPNPPDDTSAAIAFLKQILDKEGIENQTFTSKPGMANLVARLPGPPGTKPLMLMSHADVVARGGKGLASPSLQRRYRWRLCVGRAARIDNKAARHHGADDAC